MAFFLQAPKSAGTVLLSAGSATQRLRWQPHQHTTRPLTLPYFCEVCVCLSQVGGASLVWFVFLPCYSKSAGRRRPALFFGRAARSVRCAGCYVLGMGAASKKDKFTARWNARCMGPEKDCNPTAMQRQACSFQAILTWTGFSYMDARGPLHAGGRPLVEH